MNRSRQLRHRRLQDLQRFLHTAAQAGARRSPRPISLCPVDSAISQFGAIGATRFSRPKGHRYSTARSSAATVSWRPASGSSFATLYLSPRDYHRIHMPCDGRLTRMIYVPGALFSVNRRRHAAFPVFRPQQAGRVRLQKPPGVRSSLTLVGATIVGSMATTWHGVVNPPRPGAPQWRYDDRTSC